MKKHLSNIILIVILLAGLSLLLYPTVSDYWNKFHQSQAIASYAEAVADLDDETYEQLWGGVVRTNSLCDPGPTDIIPQRRNMRHMNRCSTFPAMESWVILR